MNYSRTFAITIDLGVVLAGQVKEEALRQPKIALKLTEPVTLGQLIDQLGVPRDYIGFITVNGERKDWAAMVGPDDHIILIPYITGG